jgi:predicted dehydrogenase
MQLTTKVADQFQLMVEAFAAAVLEGGRFPYPPSDAVANMRAIDALRDAARASAR